MTGQDRVLETGHAPGVIPHPDVTVKGEMTVSAEETVTMKEVLLDERTKRTGMMIGDGGMMGVETREWLRAVSVKEVNVEVTEPVIKTTKLEIKKRSGGTLLTLTVAVNDCLLATGNVIAAMTRMTETAGQEKTAGTETANVRRSRLGWTAMFRIPSAVGS